MPTSTKVKRPKDEVKSKKVKNTNFLKVDMPLLIIIIILVNFGIIMIMSASAPQALSAYNNSYKYVEKQIIAVSVGFIALFFISKFDYHKLKIFYKIFYLISLLVLFTVLIPGIGVNANGARRWIQIGKYIQLQPSEITKIFLIIFFAGYFTDPNIKINKFFYAVLLPLILMLIPAVIVYKVQNHASAAGLILLESITIMILSGLPWKYLASAFSLLFSGGLAGLYIFRNKIASGFRNDRIEAWLHTEENAGSIGYQTTQGLYAIGSGGLWGVGFGNSKQKYLYIPEAHNDFIFAILAEELGFVGCAFVVVLFVAFAIRGTIIATKSEDKFGSLIAVGITSLISYQAILNIAVVTNLFPNTGVSLPFISYGGTSIVILLATVGILLNISKFANQKKDREEIYNK